MSVYFDLILFSDIQYNDSILNIIILHIKPKITETADNSSLFPVVVPSKFC